MDGNPQSFAEFWQNIWQMLVTSISCRLVWALLVLIVGWLVAWLLANLAGKALQRFGLDRRLEQSFPGGKASASALKIEKVVTRIVFYTILLLTVLACLTSLNLSDAAAPVRES